MDILQKMIGNKIIWLVIAVILLFFRPVIYFIFGKGQEE